MAIEVKKNRTINFYGGKQYMVRDIIKDIGRAYHKLGITTVCDTFGGGGSVFFNLPNEWKINRVYNDKDKRLYVLMKVLNDKILREQLYDKLSHSLTSRDLYKDAKDFFEGDWETADKVDIAYNLVYIFTNSFNGGQNSFTNHMDFLRYRPTHLEGLVSNMENFWMKRRRDSIIENMDYHEFIEKYDGKNVLQFIDAPYIIGGRGNYEHDFTFDDFKELGRVLKEIEGTFILTESERDFKYVYEVLGEPYAIRDYISFGVLSREGGKKTIRKEGFWTGGHGYKPF